MKTIEAYRLKDGTTFLDKKKALLYEFILNKCESIEERFFLTPKNKPNESYCIQQDKTKINDAWNEFATDVLKSYISGFDKQIEGTIGYFVAKHLNSIENINRIVTECCSELPCVNNLFFRFLCISTSTFIEYEQPYFVTHEEQFDGIKIVL